MDSSPIKSRFWFQAARARLVAEVEEVRANYPHLTLAYEKGHLTWTGELRAFPLGVEAEPLQVRLVYSSGFPVTEIKVFPLSPVLPAEMWGHGWHRYPSGALCLCDPEKWQPSYTAHEVIEKAADWYFNWLALQAGLIQKMPDVGRAVLCSD